MSGSTTGRALTLLVGGFVLTAAAVVLPSAALARELEAFVGDEPDDLDVREHAVFAISELPEEQAIPALIRIATTNPHISLRRAALFWLAESEDPRALELFEELLGE